MDALVLSMLQFDTFLTNSSEIDDLPDPMGPVKHITILTMINGIE